MVRQNICPFWVPHLHDVIADAQRSGYPTSRFKPNVASPAATVNGESLGTLPVSAADGLPDHVPACDLCHLARKLPQNFLPIDVLALAFVVYLGMRLTARAGPQGLISPQKPVGYSCVTRSSRKQLAKRLHYCATAGVTAHRNATGRDWGVIIRQAWSLTAALVVFAGALTGPRKPTRPAGGSRYVAVYWTLR